MHANISNTISVVQLETVAYVRDHKAPQAHSEIKIPRTRTADE